MNIELLVSVISSTNCCLKFLQIDYKSFCPSLFQKTKVLSKQEGLSQIILMAFKTLYYIKHQYYGKLGFMALKLDMSKSKAYDKVKWSSPELLLRRMGFHETWVALMMEYITTISYSLLINGEPIGTIRPTKGIRQGDLLLPYLFLLCTEGLYGLLNKATTIGSIRGVSICRNGPRLTQLFFADRL